MDARPSKRQKMSFDEEDYARGSIKQIYMENFMTYKQATVVPGPRLNMVLGPNGSGKSSVVCSICIGLNGKTALLGRATDLKEFVRKGESKGLVRITISGGPGHRDIVFERTIHAQDNKSVWKINNAPKTEKDVNAETKKLNIQLDNLCQFLPQEKVGEFAKMTPVELLKNTERAIGDAHLLRMHEKLIEGGTELHKLEDEMATAARQLNALKEKKEGMSRDVAKIREQERLFDEAARFRARAAWLRVDKDEEVLEAAEEQLEQQVRKEQQLQASLNKKRKPLEERKQRLGPLQAKVKELTSATAARQRELENKVMKYIDEDAENEFDNIFADLKRCDEQESARQAKLANARKMLQQVDQEIEDFSQKPNPVDPEEEKRVAAERGQLGIKLNELSVQKRDLLRRQDDASQQLQAAEQRLHRLNQVSHQRLQRLNQSFRGIEAFKARVDEMKRNNQFRGNVYGPIALEIQMTIDSPQGVNALEMHVNRRMFANFVTEQRDDQDLIVAVAQQMNFRVNVVNYNSNPNQPLMHRNQPASHWRHLGVTHTLDEVFDAPMTVKHVLDDTSRISSTFLVDGEDKLERVWTESPINMVYTAEARTSKVTSRYNRNAKASFSSSALANANLLAGQVDKQEVKRCEDQIQQARAVLDSLQPQFDELERQMAAVKQEQTQLEQLQDKMKRAKTAHLQKGHHLKVKRTKIVATIDQAEKQAPLAKKAEFNNKLAQVKKKFARVVQQMVDTMQQQLENQKELAVACANEQRCVEELANLEQQLHNEKAELEMVKMQAAGLKAGRNAARQKLDASTSRAEAMLPKSDRNAHAELARLPDDEEECSLKAGALQDKAEAIAIGDPGMIERYNQLSRQVAEQEARDAELRTQVQKYKTDLEDARQKWLPELKEKVDAISAKFSENFKRIGSVGEVGLREDGENFDKYAIEIRVKFRPEEELEVLDVHRQSGGERSVSTIMYLLSLQNITHTPLRVVDEINQGMDTTNERRVFQAMVDAATERGTPQCLLMTPKLLPQLSYSQHVNVLQILNGAHCSEPVQVYSPYQVLSTLIGPH